MDVKTSLCAYKNPVNKRRYQNVDSTFFERYERCVRTWLFSNPDRWRSVPLGLGGGFDPAPVIVELFSG